MDFQTLEELRRIRQLLERIADAVAPKPPIREQSLQEQVGAISAVLGCGPED